MQEFLKNMSLALTALVWLNFSQVCDASEVTVREASGKGLYIQKCVACHQANASGNVALKAPSIAGMDAMYTQRQISSFQSGLRGGASDDPMSMSMAATVAGMAEKDVVAISEYVASLAVVDLELEKIATGFRGKGLYSGCLSCHGADGEGYPELGAPRISNQYPWYLKSQLLSFRAGTRGASEGDKYGAQMKAMADAINSEDDLDVLVNYISGLGQ